MRNLLKHIFLFCGIALLMLAAFPVFAQDYIRPNKKPIQDFTQMVIEHVQTGELVLSENFLVEFEGELKKDGKFELEKTRFIRTEGDEKMIDVAKSAIEAVNDSGAFGYLERVGSKKVNLVLAQNDSELYAVLDFGLDSTTRLKTVTSMLDMFVKISKTNSKNEDEKILLNGTTVSENGKTVTIKTAIEKSVGQEMIKRRLDEEMTRRQKMQTSK